MKIRSLLKIIFRFVEHQKRVFIYGAGHYGMLCHKLLTIHGERAEGFLASNPEIDAFLGIPVRAFYDILPNLQQEDGILLAMNYKNSAEVMPFLDGVKASVLQIPEVVFFYLDCKNSHYSRSALRRFSARYAALPYDGSMEWKNILVVRIDRMGDMIWTSAFFRELRRNFPKARITALIEQTNGMLMENCPYVDRVIEYDESQFQFGWENYWKMFWWTKELARKFFAGESYDAVFLPRGLMEQDKDTLSNIFFAIHSEAKVRIANWFDTTDKVNNAFRRSMGKLFSKVAEHEQPKHEVKKILDMLRAIGCESESDQNEIWIKTNSFDETDITQYRKRGEHLVVVGLVSKDRQKSWDPEKYRQLFEEIRRRWDVVFLLCGGNDAIDAARRAYDSRWCFDLSGKTNFRQMYQIMKACDLYIGSNTGLTHIAATLQKPVVEISAHFPWGDDGDLYSPVHCGPWQTKSIIVQPEKALDEVCKAKGYCVNPQPHCINTISVERVQAAVEKMMEGVSDAASKDNCKVSATISSNSGK